MHSATKVLTILVGWMIVLPYHRLLREGLVIHLHHTSAFASLPSFVIKCQKGRLPTQYLANKFLDNFLEGNNGMLECINLIAN